MTHLSSHEALGSVNRVQHPDALAFSARELQPRIYRSLILCKNINVSQREINLCK